MDIIASIRRIIQERGASIILITGLLIIGFIFLNIRACSNERDREGPITSLLPPEIEALPTDTLPEGIAIGDACQELAAPEVRFCLTDKRTEGCGKGTPPQDRLLRIGGLIVGDQEVLMRPFCRGGEAKVFTCLNGVITEANAEGTRSDGCSGRLTYRCQEGLVLPYFDGELDRNIAAGRCEAVQ